jgi:error-prone DNA polymerase
MGHYAELCSFSNFTFLTGASSPEELVMSAAQQGYEAIAITDECSVAGVVRAYSHIKEFKLPIKLIVGSHFNYQNEVKLTLLCPCREAYAELCRIITNSRRRCEKGKYELNAWDLKSVQRCLILWHATGNTDKDERDLLWLESLNKTIKKRLSMAITRKLNHGEHHYIQNCERLASKHNLPMVAGGLVHMHEQERLPLQHVLTAIKQGTTVSKLGRSALTNAEQSIRPISKLKTLYSAECLYQTIRLAQQCTFSLSELRYEYPSELIPKGCSPSNYLLQLVDEGQKKRFPNGTPDNVLALIQKELSLITEMRYEHFFITIYDIVQFAKSKGILYQGRGSAANSVVCYCLEITAVDPSQINVLFERFISKERNEPPDIDVDFEHQRREEIFQYIYTKYGRNHAALAATVVTYRTKSAIREVGKALGFEELQLDFFIKNINRRDRTSSWFNQLTELGLDPNSSKGRQFVLLVEQIKGFPRHLSQHVGGFIISSGPLYELVPVENAAMDNRTVIQWDKDDLESLALLKVDVLALGMLTAIRKSFDLLKLHYQRTITIADITAAGDDEAVYKMIQQADTVGVFQIESRAQMSMLPRLKPKTYYDLVIQIAIVRPGPIQGGMVHPYLRRREGLEAIDYPSEAVKEVLSRTLGVPIFQEQVIKLAMVAAGFSGGEADQLRRAMGKWKRNGQLNQFHQKLINGMSKRGYTEEFAERIFQQICGFGEYGFPESHSASFAVLAYVSAWLKHHHPLVFYCGLLNSLPMGFYGPAQLIQDAQRHNVKVLPVCINASEWDHQIVTINKQPSLRLGFRLVKGLRQSTVEKLVASRKSEGQFSYIGQLKSLHIASNELQALASSDSFKSIAGGRYTARWEMMDQESDLPLFNNMKTSISAPIAEVEINDVDTMIEDYASIGLSLDLHPIQLLRENGKLGKYTAAKDLKTYRHQTPVTVVGVVTGRQSPGTASGVTFMTLEDDTGNTNVVVWVATARYQKQAFLTSKILKVKGILEREGTVVHVIAGKLIDLTEMLDNLETKARDFH